MGIPLDSTHWQSAVHGATPLFSKEGLAAGPQTPGMPLGVFPPRASRAALA